LASGRSGRGRDTGAGRLLTVIGAINWDVSIFEDRFARLGEGVQVRDVEEYSGGKGANVAVAAARLLGRGRASIIGALGSDELAKRQVKELKKEGVVTDGLVTVQGSRSGRAYIVVNREGRKAIHSHFGANALLRPSHLEAEGPKEVLSRTSMLVVMDTPIDVAMAAIGAAKRRHSCIIYSPGVRVREKKEDLAEIAKGADILVLDKAELVKLSGKTDVVEASEYLQRASPNLTVVATSGKGGCVVVSGGRTARIGGVDLSLLGMKAVNSTGSGDSFVGVLASYVSRGTGVVEAARWANLAGALKATRYETRGSPTKAALEATMKQLNHSLGTSRNLRERQV